MEGRRAQYRADSAIYDRYVVQPATKTSMLEEKNPEEYVGLLYLTQNITLPRIPAIQPVHTA
jgi:hypothetical protein